MFAESHTIAVVDDETSVGRAVARLLRVHGYSVDLFEDGGSLLRAHEGRPYACILLDLHMPGMSGYEVLGALFREKATVPVIVITAKDEAGTAERVRDRGAVGYLKKPVDETPLLEAVVRAIGAQAGRVT